MTWIKAPVSYLTPEQAAQQPPYHNNELGLVWEDDDGTVWETRPLTVGGRGVHWYVCRRERATMLKEKYGA